ncbi:MAG: hypothetical protein PHV77_03885 [Candidatus Omnitrophica bacterium]|nr:hypothetical protein [Candidatus Omnitrophota bacterium]
MKKNIYIIILVVMALMAPVQARAGIMVTPDRHIVFLDPGESKTVIYNIHNEGAEDINMIIEPKGWSGLKDPYAWLSLETDEIYVRAGESTPLVANINAPEKEAGEMVAMLFLCYKDKMGSQLNIKNGVPLYMIVKGTEYYSLNIKDIHISFSRKNDFLDLNFNVEMENTGNVHIVPDISIAIKNNNGRQLNELILKRPHIVLRGKTQLYTLSWREPDLRDGTYKATVMFEFEDKIKQTIKEFEFNLSGVNVSLVE